MKEKIKIAVIGAGFGAAVHIPAFKSFPDVELVAVASSRLEKAKITAGKYGIPHAFEGYESILDVGLDAVSIALPPYISGKAIKAAQKRHLHILAEKPLAATCGEINEILSVNTDKVQMVNFQFPELRAFKKLQEMIASGQYGQVRMVNIKWLVESYSERNNLMDWKRSRELGGGVLNLLGTHLLHYLEYLFGEIEFLMVRCCVVSPGSVYDNSVADNMVSILFTMKRGFCVTAMMSNAAPFSHSHSIEIVFDKANVLLKNETEDYMNGFYIKLKSHDEKGIIYADETLCGIDGRLPAFKILADRFLNGIKTKLPTCRPTFYDAYRAQELVELIIESGLKKKEISVSSR